MKKIILIAAIFGITVAVKAQTKPDGIQVSSEVSSEGVLITGGLSSGATPITGVVKFWEIQLPESPFPVDEEVVDSIPYTSNSLNWEVLIPMSSLKEGATYRFRMYYGNAFATLNISETFTVVVSSIEAIHNETSSQKFTVTNLQGQVVLTGETTHATHLTDVAFLPKGTYIIFFERSKIAKKIIKVS